MHIYLSLLIYERSSAPIFCNPTIILSIMSDISSSFNVLSEVPKVREYAMLFLPSAIPFPLYKSNGFTSNRSFPPFCLIVFAISCDFTSSFIRIAMSFFTFGYFDIS